MGWFRDLFTKKNKSGDGGNGVIWLRIFLMLILPLAIMITLADGLFLPKVKDAFLKPKTTPPVMVSLVTVHSGSRNVNVTYTGTVQPESKALIASKILAQVQSVNFTVGQTVNSGDLLVALDGKDLAAEASQAQAQVAAAQAQVSQAQVTENEDHADYDRDKVLYASGAITEYDYQHASDKVDLDAAALAAAQSQLASAQANLAYADTEEGYTDIYAPFTGVITEKDVNVGNMATAGQQLCVEEAGPYRLEVPLPETYNNVAPIGGHVAVTIPAISANVTGVVNEVVPTVSPTSMTYLVKISLPANLPVKSGMYGNADFSTGSTNDIFIPASAVVEWGDVKGVFVDANGQAEFTYVTTGNEVNGQEQILSGLSAGEQVVVSDVGSLQNGQRVEGTLANG